MQSAKYYLLRIRSLIQVYSMEVMYMSKVNSGLSRVGRLVQFYWPGPIRPTTKVTFLTLDPIQPDPPKTENFVTRPDPTRPDPWMNPTRVWNVLVGFTQILWVLYGTGRTTCRHRYPIYNAAIWKRVHLKARKFAWNIFIKHANNKRASSP